MIGRFTLFAFILLASVVYSADDASVAKFATELRELDSRVFPEDRSGELRSMVRDDLRQRLQQANDLSSKGWYAVKSRSDWEKFRQPRIDALRKSLGTFPDPPKKIRIRKTRELKGDGFRIQNLVYESRDGLWVTANLYLPDKRVDSMPGIILCHSHHRPKEHGELQDMGMTWARAGCAVLVPDHLGHGERRQHPFASGSDFPNEFRVSRQDYYFRYDTGIQLHLVGESLVGWMAWDLSRGVDVLLTLKGIDPERIALLGAVAGGGDPAAVCAALDDRIQCAVPFNFGGPQPETRYPLPKDVEKTFNYAGSGGWESTRNLQQSAADGFLPWVIVGGIAPRRLIFAHEFTWHREFDPVWKRLQSIYKLYGVRDNLAFTHGRGELRGRPPQATHCTHIGRFHRQKIHEAFKKWFDISVSEEDEYSARRPSEELHCMTDDLKGEIQPERLIDLLPKLASERVASVRKELSSLPAKQQRLELRERWREVLGDVEPKLYKNSTQNASQNQRVIKGVFEFESDIKVPYVLLRPKNWKPDQQYPLVIAVSQGGKAQFLKHRSNELALLSENGCAVLLPDLRGTGETKPGNDRGRYSADTGRSSTELMLGSTTLGARLGELRAMIREDFRGSIAVDRKRIAVWGDSFAAPNQADAEFVMPRRIDGRPKQSEPLGSLLALFGALFEDEIRALYGYGGLDSFASVLQSQNVFIPHDIVVPGALTCGDLSDVSNSLKSIPVRFEGVVDGLNRRKNDDDRTSPAKWLLASLNASE